MLLLLLGQLGADRPVWTLRHTLLPDAFLGLLAGQVVPLLGEIQDHLEDRVEVLFDLRIRTAS